MNAWARIVFAVVLGGAAGSAEASSVLAYANGFIWGTGGGEQNSGTGLSPVTATANYVRPTQPVDGQFNAFSVASVGRLAATAGLAVSNVPIFLFTDTRIDALASFQDVWAFTGQPLDAPGRLRITLSFSGAGSGVATGALVDVFGQFDLYFNAMTGLSNVHDSVSYNSGQQQAVADTVALELDFLYGRPVLVNGRLVAHFQLRPSVVSGGYSGGGQALFGNTAELIGLEVQDAQGQWSASYTLGTESGGLYPFQAVPEPGVLLLFAFGLFVLAIARGSDGLLSRSSKATERFLAFPIRRSLTEVQQGTGHRPARSSLPQRSWSWK